MRQSQQWRPDVVPPPPHRPPTRSGTLARGFTGSLAVGLLSLSLVLIGIQFWATHVGQEGPGLDAVITHGVSACVVLTMQSVADRRRDLVGGLLTAGVLLGTLANLWFWWWL
ncbi:hypothetical protein [Parasphingorhabdus pacifica]